MVAAVESEAVERALVRVLQGPAVENAVHGALDSETVKQALVDALDSEMVDEVWRRLLASDEAQKLVERIAEAPELRAAISAQSVGLIEDVGHTIGNSTRRPRRRRRADRPQGLLPQAAHRSRPNDAGAVTRALAFGLDVLIVNLAFSGVAAIAALVASAFSGNDNGLSGLTLAVGSFAWLVPRLLLPRLLLVARRADARDALLRHPHRPQRRAIAAAPLDQAARRPGAGDDRLRPRLPRDLLRRTPARLAGPDGRRRRPLRAQRAALRRRGRASNPSRSPGRSRWRRAAPPTWERSRSGR